MSEFKAPSERFTPLSREELQTFRDRVLKSGSSDQGPITLYPLLDRAGNDVKRPFRGDGVSWSSRLVDHISGPEVLTFVGETYDAHDEKARKILLQHD